jgi:hypothetical protein
VPHLKLFISLSVVGILIGFLASEGLLRVSGYVPFYLDQRAFIPSKDPELIWELQPGFKGLFAAVPISINSLGFRGKELLGPQDASVFRVVLLGDSIAFSQGVHEEETLAEQLAKRLRRKLDTPVEVINTGVPGYETCQEYETFRERALVLRPKVAVVIYVDNDVDEAVTPVFQIAGNSVISPDVRTGLFGDLAAAARKRSAAYNLVWTRWNVIKLRSRRYSIETYRKILATKFNERNPGWRKSRACLIDLIHLARARSVRIMVIPFPPVSGLREKPYPFAGYITTVCDVARAEGVLCVDVVPAIQQPPGIRLVVSTSESHPSAQVLARVADRLTEVLP